MQIFKSTVGLSNHTGTSIALAMALIDSFKGTKKNNMPLKKAQDV